MRWRAAWLGVLAPVATLLAGPALASPPPARTASLSRCHTRDLAGVVRPGNPGAGQRYAVLVLRNRSRRTCTVFGYVGLRLVDRHGRALPTRVVHYRSPRPRRVVVRPGAHASTLLHWGAMPTPPEPQRLPCEPTPARVQVTPPNEATHLLLRWPGGPVCDRGRIDRPALRAGSRGF